MASAQVLVRVITAPDLEGVVSSISEAHEGVSSISEAHEGVSSPKGA